MPNYVELKQYFLPINPAKLVRNSGSERQPCWFLTCCYSGTGVCLHYSAFFTWTTV